MVIAVQLEGAPQPASGEVIAIPPLPRVATTEYHARLMACRIRRSLEKATIPGFHALVLGPDHNMFRLQLTADYLGLRHRSHASKIPKAMPSKTVDRDEVKGNPIQLCVATDSAAVGQALMDSGADLGIAPLVSLGEDLAAVLSGLATEYPEIDHLYIVPGSGNWASGRLADGRHYSGTHRVEPGGMAPTEHFVWDGDLGTLAVQIVRDLAASELRRAYTRGNNTVDCALALDVACDGYAGGDPESALVECRLKGNEYTRATLSPLAGRPDLLVEAWATEWACRYARCTETDTRNYQSSWLLMMDQLSDPICRGIHEDEGCHMQSHLWLVKKIPELVRTTRVLRAKLDALAEVHLVAEHMAFLRDPGHELEAVRPKDVLGEIDL